MLKKIKHKISLEIMRYIAKTNPELCSRFEEIIITYQNKSFYDVNFVLTVSEPLLKKSKSQIRQDLFVLSELNYKRNGFFVEFGATNGIHLSNTYLLETDFEWNGILAEPAKLWHNDLDKNRKAIIDKRCVWKRSGETLIFNETSLLNYQLSILIALATISQMPVKAVKNIPLKQFLYLTF